MTLRFHYKDALTIKLVCSHFPPRFSLEMDMTLYVKVHIVYSISAQSHHLFVCYFNLRQIIIDNIGESSIFKGFNLYVIDFTMDN